MGAKKAPPKQSKSAQAAQEAAYMKKANKNKVKAKVKNTMKKFNKAKSESDYTDKANKIAKKVTGHKTKSQGYKPKRKGKTMAEYKAGGGKRRRKRPTRRPRSSRRSIARTQAANRKLLNRAGSGRRQIKRSVGRTQSLNRRNLRGSLGRSGRGFRGRRR